MDAPKRLVAEPVFIDPLEHPHFRNERVCHIEFSTFQGKLSNQLPHSTLPACVFVLTFNEIAPHPEIFAARSVDQPRLASLRETVELAAPQRVAGLRVRLHLHRISPFLRFLGRSVS
jgi:hypothetical protein